MAEFRLDSNITLDWELERKEKLKTLFVLNNFPLTSMDPPMAIQEHRMTEAMMSEMACIECGQLFPAEQRYVCEDGHLYCSACGKDRGIKHEFKCRVECVDGIVEEYAQEEPLYFPICQKKIIRCPPNPVYTALRCNAAWKCPNENIGCKSQITVTDFHLHSEECDSKYPQHEEKIASTQEQNESSSVAAVSLKKPCPISGCQVVCSDNEIMEHLTAHHRLKIYVMKRNDEGFDGLINIPESIIEDRVPYHYILRRPEEVFLLCFEPVFYLASHDHLGIWIRQLNVINSVDGKEKEPVSVFNFLLEDSLNEKHTQVRFTSNCSHWGKPTEDVVDERKCMVLPYCFIKMNLLRKETMDNADLDLEEEN